MAEKWIYFYKGHECSYLNKIADAMKAKLNNSENEFNLKKNGLTILIFRDEEKTLLTDSDLNDICYIYKEISSSAYDWEVALAILHCARCMDYDEMRDWGKRFPTNRGI